MQTSFTKRFRKYVLWAGALFVAMLVFRLIYGYVSTGNDDAGDVRASRFFSSVDNLRKNYASEKSRVKDDMGEAAAVASGQKYEKTASVNSTSSQFETDASSIRSQARQFEGVIQYEQNMGNAGSRELHLMIGINPEKFDGFYAVVQKIGKIQAREVTKTDKTNEYRQLNAKKASLGKILTSLNELKSRGGEISDYISLHDKILEIETQLQELGVELGNFDTENEFCTVRFSLYEGATEQQISFLHRLKVALEWTIKYYITLMASVFFMLGSVFLLLLVIEKLGIVKTTIDDKMKEP